jgi:SAM-dependent methyltransferase
VVAKSLAQPDSRQPSSVLPAGSDSANGAGDTAGQPALHAFDIQHGGIAAHRFARIGPVHFQPLEWELEPLRMYFGGRALNAGCGNRDITETLRGFGATEVVNYDIASEIPGARLGPLEKMPFAAAEFDSILCNAVLEHVEAPEPVIREMVRVLRPGGYLVVAIPFLQPFHPCPGDFRRYTREGMRRLGIDSGLEVIAIHPTHTIAQTLGWIIWTYLEEKKSRVRKAILYPLLWCFTRFSCRTDSSLIGTANTFQAAYRKLP